METKSRTTILSYPSAIKLRLGDEMDATIKGLKDARVARDEFIGTLGSEDHAGRLVANCICEDVEVVLASSIGHFRKAWLDNSPVLYPYCTEPRENALRVTVCAEPRGGKEIIARLVVDVSPELACSLPHGLTVEDRSLAASMIFEAMQTAIYYPEAKPA